MAFWLWFLRLYWEVSVVWPLSQLVGWERPLWLGMWAGIWLGAGLSSFLPVLAAGLQAVAAALGLGLVTAMYRRWRERLEAEAVLAALADDPPPPVVRRII